MDTVPTRQSVRMFHILTKLTDSYEVRYGVKSITGQSFLTFVERSQILLQ